MGSKAGFSIDFGRSVRKIRLQKEISQEELGFLSKLDRTYVSRVELGKVNLSLQAAWAIAEGLSTPLSELIKEAEQQL